SARVRVAVGIAVVTAVVATVVAMVPPVLAVLAARLRMVAVVPAALVAVVVAGAVASAPVVVGHGNGRGGGGRQRQHQGGAPLESTVHVSLHDPGPSACRSAWGEYRSGRLNRRSPRRRPGRPSSRAFNGCSAGPAGPLTL